MKLSRRGRYALRSLIYLTLQGTEEKINLKNIAKMNDISVKYLEQIFADLKRAGIVRSIQGVHGGYYLTRSPQKINAEEILDAVEGEYYLTDETPVENNLMQGISNTLQRRVVAPLNEQARNVIEHLTLQDLADDYVLLEKNVDEMYYI